MRAFLAVPLPPAGHLAVEEIQQCLRNHDAFSDFRWVPPANVHLTLRFLGEITEEEAGPVAAALEAACLQARACSFELNRLGVFPNPKNPGVIWAGPAEPPAALLSLEAGLSAGLGAAGFEPEARPSRPFRPHLTLARCRRRGRGRGAKDLAQALREAERTCLASRPTLSLTEAALFKSELRPGGAVHTVLRRAELPGI
ncbi:MAG: RNA 2',3'-cyclic phosphodiesterase [bacterium]